MKDLVKDHRHQEEEAPLSEASMTTMKKMRTTTNTSMSTSTATK